MTLFLRLEHLAIALAALYGYWLTDGGWTLFLILVLAPDLAFIAYLAGSRVGAWGYNALHSFIGPVALWAVGHAAGWSLAAPVALVWIFHIAFDRAVGYGLKHESGFRRTHFGPIGGAK